MILIIAAVALPFWEASGALLAQQLPAAPSCHGVEGFHRLDFWIGEWDVRVNGTTVGRDRVEKILSGCAIVESWRDARGSEGRGFFYYQPATDTWKQVWVTDQATRAGGVKEKTLVEMSAGEGVRFQGEIPISGGGSYLDRTTLIPLAGGRVRQVIETSRDGGESWETGFDAVYVPVPRD